MRLHEYQAKKIFSEYGIRVPKGKVAESVEDVEKIAEELGGKVILKSQILVGGRGKAGGVKKANTVDEAIKIAESLFGKEIKGHIVRKIYVEEVLPIEQELFVGLTIDRVRKGVALIVSSIGGMDVEEIASRYPEKISSVIINPKWGLWDYQIRELLLNSDIERSLWKEMFSVIKKLYQIMIKFEAELTEINPLAVVDDKLIAADARLNIDDSALYRHKELESLRDYTEANELERIAMEKGLNYVKLEGDIGVIANGAGMAMSTMDLIYLSGGKPANFLDIGGGASAEVVSEAMRIILQDESVKVLFINIFGGITRCDQVAQGLIQAFDSVKVEIPVVVRLAGTNEKEGRQILTDYAEKSGENILLVESMEEGAAKSVELVRKRSITGGGR
jgi:succinyl-CoA synthetase beta subunit